MHIEIYQYSNIIWIMWRLYHIELYYCIYIALNYTNWIFFIVLEEKNKAKKLEVLLMGQRKGLEKKAMFIEIEKFLLTFFNIDTRTVPKCKVDSFLYHPRDSRVIRVIRDLKEKKVKHLSQRDKWVPQGIQASEDILEERAWMEFLELRE